MGCCISALLLRVELRHTSLTHGVLLGLLNGWGVATGSNVLQSTPFPAQEPMHEGYVKSVPWMLSEQCSACIVCDQHSVVHTAPHLKVLYSQIKIRKQTCRSTFASQMPVGLASVSNPKFRYLQGSCPLVVRMLHLTGAGWSGLL